MDKTLTEFKDQILDYMNQFVIPDDTIIKEIIFNENEQTNRGHVLQVRLQDETTASPLFYIEELYEQVKQGRSVPYIAESIRAQTHQLADRLKSLTETMQDNPVNLEEAIITVIPNAIMSDTYKKVKETSVCRDNNLGFTEFLKYPIQKNDTEGYYVNIITDDVKSKGIEITDEVWEKAIQNTLKMTDIRIACVGAKSKAIPQIIDLRDMHTFADYFYLTNKKVLEEVCEKLNVTGLYIIPQEPFSAVAFPIAAYDDNHQIMEYDFDIRKSLDEFHNMSTNGKAILPIYEYDNATQELKIYEE